MTIEIITPNDGWILHRMAHKLAARIPGVTVVDKPSGAADIVYFMHYHMYRAVTVGTAAWFTHREPDGHPLHHRWSEVADAVDLCIASCDLYAEQLPSEKTVVILPGVDDRFQPRKLRVGVACQWAHGNEHRKGLDLIRRLNDECADWIDLRLTNGDIPDDDMVAWYQGLSVYLVSSRIEGGPQPALEAAACGIPVVAPRVGFMSILEQLNPSLFITFYEAGNYEEMVTAIKQAGEPLYRRHAHLIRRDFSWDRFAQQHREQFEKLLI